MVDVVEESFDVSLYEPAYVPVALSDLHERRVTPSNRSEPVTFVAKAWFVVGFQQQIHYGSLNSN